MAKVLLWGWRWRGIPTVLSPKVSNVGRSLYNSLESDIIETSARLGKHTCNVATGVAGARAARALAAKVILCFCCCLARDLVFMTISSSGGFRVERSFRSK